mgnify:CR=1 FL=1
MKTEEPTDVRLIDYASWKARIARINMFKSPSRDARLERIKLEKCCEVWLALAKAVVKSEEFWSFVRRIDYAGHNAIAILDEAPDINTIALAEDVVDSKEESAPSVEEVRAQMRRDPRWAMRKFQVVETVATDSHGRVYIPFDLLDEDNPRSCYQSAAYGKFIDKFVQGENPSGSPHLEARTKPRQVGSTEFWKQFAVFAVQAFRGYRAMLHFPLEDDAKDHLRTIMYQLDRMAKLWPDLFYGMIKRSVADGHLILANGSEIVIRYAGGSGLTKLGGNFNMVILSEAGKYEKLGANIWSTINQVVVPAVHAGPHNVIVWEGTNDELARELQRIAVLARDPVTPYNFEFYPWTILNDYVGPPIVNPDRGAVGRYSDYDLIDGNRIPISEATYSERGNLTPEQIGFRRLKIDGLGDLDLFHREYPMSYEESCTSSYSSFFGPSVTQKKYPAPKFICDITGNADAESVLMTRLKYSVDIKQNGQWHIWHEPQDGEEYILAGDFSDGIPGGDYTALGLFRLSDGHQCASARFRGGARNDIIIASQMAYVVKWYGSRVYVIGELNNVGKSVRSRWIDFGYGRNYHRILERKSYDQHTDSMWFLQTASSRGPLVLRFRSAISEGKIVLNDERFGWDAQDFIKHESGKYAAAEIVSAITGEKARDDMIMMASLAWEMLRTHPLRARILREKPAAPQKIFSYKRNETSIDDDSTYAGLFGKRFAARSR